MATDSASATLCSGITKEPPCQPVCDECGHCSCKVGGSSGATVGGGANNGGVTFNSSSPESGSPVA